MASPVLFSSSTFRGHVGTGTPDNTRFWRGDGTWQLLTSIYDPANVAITGGTINGTSVGATTASSGRFTTLTTTGNLTVGDASTDTAAFQAGSAALPSIIPSGDPNTGLWFPAADTIAFSNNGAETVRIGSTGNVGVGRSPTFQFDVYRTGTTNTSVAFANDNVTGLFQVVGSSQMNMGTVTNHKIVFVTNNTSRMTLGTSGDLSIGTAALATTATTGFLWAPSCAGVPTGAPTAPYTNAAAIVADTTNSRLYVLIGATWKYAALT